MWSAYRCSIPSCSDCSDRRCWGPSRPLSSRRLSAVGIQLELPLHDFARAACKLSQTPPAKNTALSPSSTISSLFLFFLSFQVLCRLSGLRSGGTMTVIRSVFVPDDGWLRPAPGRPSKAHLRHPNLEISTIYPVRLVPSHHWTTRHHWTPLDPHRVHNRGESSTRFSPLFRVIVLPSFA